MITEMNIMLGGKEFLALHAESLCKVLHLTVGKVRPRGAKYIGLVLESLLIEHPLEGGQVLLRSGVLGTMLRSCALNSANDEHAESDRVISVYLNSLTRILVASQDILDGLLPLDPSGVSGYPFGYTELVRVCFIGGLCSQ